MAEGGPEFGQSLLGLTRLRQQLSQRQSNIGRPRGLKDQVAKHDDGIESATSGGERQGSVELAGRVGRG